MSHDTFKVAAEEVAESWEKEAAMRKARTPSDPVAEMLASCSLELRERLSEVERDTAYLTVAQYAQQNGASESTIRRLCAAGLIEGAERDVRKEWRIPRGARRRAVAS